ncbi:MAG: hypothetical protein LBB48_01690 [Treponema sp.]|nr:hypothetical protein [Treponema sp.]
MKKIKCSKCGGAPSFYKEIWSGAVMMFDAETFESYGNEDYGDPYCVQAICGKCGHIWRIRGITQITDIPGAPETREEWKGLGVK